MPTYRKGLIPPVRRVPGLLSLMTGLFLLFPSVSAASYTLHFTGAKRTPSAHRYSFSGSYNYHDGTVAERVMFSVKGIYTPKSAVAKEVMTFTGSWGTSTMSVMWGCVKDPWLDRGVSCSLAHEPTISPRQGYVVAYPSFFCDRRQHEPFCFPSRNLVPARIAPLMRNGPPPPRVTGPAQALSSKGPVLTLKYASGVANRYWIQKWYCPPGKDGAPTNTPIDTSPFGGPCTSSAQGPSILQSKDSTTQFPLAYPKTTPKAGYWYVRARLGSNRWGKGGWGHWRRTVVKAPVHFQDAIRPPLILKPTEGQRFINQNIAFSSDPRVTHPNCANWYIEYQWQRAKTVEPTNHPPKREYISKARVPWTNAAIATQSRCHVNTFALRFRSFRSHTDDYGYRYWFRIREHERGGGNHTSAWSPWRSFIVQEPIRVKVLPGFQSSSPASGNTKSLKRAPSTAVHPLNLPVQH